MAAEIAQEKSGSEFTQEKSGSEFTQEESGSEFTQEESRSEILHLRPHHLLCIQNYSGHGYSPAFDQKMQAVITLLRAAPAASVRLIEGADDLCAACPHCKSGICESDQPALFDSRVCAHTGFVPGDVVPWKCAPVMTKDLLKTCCRGCSWIGLCTAILTH